MRLADQNTVVQQKREKQSQFYLKKEEKEERNNSHACQALRLLFMICGVREMNVQLRLDC